MAVSVGLAIAWTDWRNWSEPGANRWTLLWVSEIARRFMWSVMKWVWSTYAKGDEAIMTDRFRIYERWNRWRNSLNDWEVVTARNWASCRSEYVKGENRDSTTVYELWVREKDRYRLCVDKNREGYIFLVLTAGWSFTYMIRDLSCCGW